MAQTASNEKTPLLKDGSFNNATSKTNDELNSPDSSSPPQHRYRLYRWLALITVEPALFLHMLAYGIESVFKTNMIVDKTCSIQLHYSSEVCDNLDSGAYDKQQDTVQSYTTLYNLYCQWIELGPAVLIIFLLGTLSDTRSRRVPLLLPMIGATLKALGLCMNAYWWSLEPYYILISYIPYGLSGSVMSTFMAAYAYISERSSPKWRTTRLSFASVMMYMSMPIGHTLGAVVFNYWGYTAVFVCEFLASLLSVLYILVRVRDERPKQISREQDCEEREKYRIWKKLKQSVLMVVRKRDNGVRAQIFGYASCVALYVMSYGSMQFVYLYTRKKFEWTYYNYTIWSNFSSPASIIGICIVLPLLSTYWRVDDVIISFIGAASHSFFGIIVGTATAPWMLYLALAVSAGGGMTITASRGALSKLVAPDELGAVFSVIGLGESLLPLLSSPLYTIIYNKTLEVFPGTIFIIAGVISLVICCIYTWLGTAFLPPLKDSKA